MKLTAHCCRPGIAARPEPDDDADDGHHHHHRRRRPPPSYPGRPATKPLLLLVAAALLARPAAAALVAFDNCLADNYQSARNPVLLQWVPLYVDAAFDTQSPRRTLRVTMFGNVTGERTNDPLPAWDSPAWADANVTVGKIEREPDASSQAPKLTTLHAKLDMLTYEPWNADLDFCTSLNNYTCPLGPVFNKTPM